MSRLPSADIPARSEQQKALGQQRSRYSSSSAQTAKHLTGTALRASCQLLSIFHQPFRGQASNTGSNWHMGGMRSMHSSSNPQTATHWTGTVLRALLSTPQELTTQPA
ncbi:TPA: hypothetical protein ACH3X1_000407 [Trebouxia sp. C0004]